VELDAAAVLLELRAHVLAELLLHLAVADEAGDSWLSVLPAATWCEMGLHVGSILENARKATEFWGSKDFRWRRP
jgi:hypothetical protein